MADHKYTKEQRDYIVSKFKSGLNSAEVALAFNNKFGLDLDKGSAYRVYNYYKMTNKKFTKKQLNWLKKESYKFKSYESLYETFIKEFNEDMKFYDFKIRFFNHDLYIETSNIRGKRLEWIKNNSKEKTVKEIMDDFYNKFKVPLKETVLRQILFKNKLEYKSVRGLPVGSLRYFNDELYIKVMENDGNSDVYETCSYNKPYWVKACEYVYSLYVGDIGEGEIIGYRDGNKNNLSVENLVKYNVGYGRKRRLKVKNKKNELKFIELTNLEGNKVYVSVNKIIYLNYDEDKTYIKTVSEMFFVKETPEEILEIVNK